MRLIDEILDEFKDINYAYNDSSKFDTLKRMLNDAVEVVHVEWKIDEYGIYHCPICHAINNTVYKNFCPNCGAKMDGEVKSDGQIL